MCDGRTLASPLFRCLAGRGVFFCCFPFRWILRLVSFLIAVVLCMDHHLTIRMVLLMIVVAHAILFLAFSSLLCGFVATQLFWCKRLRQWKMFISHVLRHSCSDIPHAYRWDPCPWNDC